MVSKEIFFFFSFIKKLSLYRFGSSVKGLLREQLGYLSFSQGLFYIDFVPKKYTLSRLTSRQRDDSIFLYKVKIINRDVVLPLNFDVSRSKLKRTLVNFDLILFV